MGIQLIGHIGRLAPVIVKVIIDAHFPCFALLGYYHYDTVGGTCSVNGGRSGVLQDCDLIDVFSIQIAEIPLFGNHIVYYIKRSAPSTDRDTGKVIQTASAGCDQQTGSTSCQALGDVCRRCFDNVFCIDTGNGGGCFTFRSRTVTYYDDFIQRFSVFFHRDA